MNPIEKNLFKLFSIPRYFKRAISFGVDFILLHLAFFSSLGVLNLALPDTQTWIFISITALITQGALLLMNFYSNVTRYLTIKNMLVLVLGALLAQSVFKVLTLRFDSYPTFWFSEMVVTAMVICVLLGGIRIAVLSYFSHYMNRQKERIIIYGAGSLGRQLALSLQNDGDYFPIAFVDADVAKQGTYIRGIKVHAVETLEYLINNYEVGLILLAIPNSTRNTRKEIIERLANYSVAVKIVPRLKNILGGTLNAADFQEVEVEDLLGRDPIAPKEELLKLNIHKKSVLVTGAGGSIGSELARQILYYDPHTLILLDASEFALYSILQELRVLTRGTTIIPVLCSVLEQDKIKKLLKMYKVQTIYHAAAYKHVPLVEANAVAGIKNNVFGTGALARAAIESDVEKFVLISTDKAVRPTNVMGASKRLAELVLQALELRSTKTSFSMVRFGNVLGSSGSVVPLFKQQICKGGPVTVTHRDIIRYFMTIPEAAQLVIQAGAMGRGGDVFVLDMGDPVRIEQLARRMIYLMGYKVRDADNPQGDIAIQYTGLRPGEKLYEELLVDDQAQTTSHPRILRAHESFISWEELQALLDQIEEACNQDDPVRLKQILLHAPLQFQPKEAIN